MKPPMDADKRGFQESINCKESIAKESKPCEFRGSLSARQSRVVRLVALPRSAVLPRQRDGAATGGEMWSTKCVALTQEQGFSGSTVLLPALKSLEPLPREEIS